MVDLKGVGEIEAFWLNPNLLDNSPSSHSKYLVSSYSDLAQVCSVFLSSFHKFSTFYQPLCVVSQFFFVCLGFQIILFVISTFTPIIFIEISFIYPTRPRRYRRMLKSKPATKSATENALSVSSVSLLATLLVLSSELCFYIFLF